MAGAFSVRVEGATLAGERRGEGAPLVMLHGMAGCRRDWDRLVAALPADPATLRYDLRGFGESVSDDIPYSHAEDLVALFDAQEIDRAPLLGLSMGGGVALNFALSHPERVSHLVLISPAMIGWEWSDTPELRAAIDAYHGAQWIRDPQRPELPDIDRLHTLAPPTLLLTGEHDVPDIRLIAEVIAAAAPHVRRVDYAGAGHMLQLERPREVAAEIAGFLGA
jgi:pimeloyl-ACP methyl ester carboxylesterase